MSFQRENIRLPSENYLGKRWFFITLCCADRQKFFIRPGFCNWFLETLRRNAVEHRFAVYAYCLMPDHIHLLVEGLEPGSDLLQFVKALKTKSSTAVHRKTGCVIWQKKFYDHILRQKDSPDAVAWYIWMNPVRAGMCVQPGDYLFLGSFAGVEPRKLTFFGEWRPPWRKAIKVGEVT